jgi:NADPH:quinone reductase-like Zn-dependent oxidoreductase
MELCCLQIEPLVRWFYQRKLSLQQKETHMQAIVRTRYGSPDVLQLQEVKPPVPKDSEVLVKVHAASVNALDWHLMRGSPFLVRTGGGGWRKPKDPRLGIDLAGRVEAVGSRVTQVQVGDEVFGRGDGAFAEYACAEEDAVVLKPATVTFEAAAAVPVAALTALRSLRDAGQVQPGQQVLIQGASGGVGTFAVQIAKALGAEVTAVCSPRTVEQTRAIGANHVLDYTKSDFTKGRSKDRQRYDLILAVNGYHPIWAYRRVLRPKGRYVLVGASSAHLLPALLQAMILGPVLSRTGTRQMGFYMGLPTHEDLVVLKEWLEAGSVVPIIERSYPLQETAEAIRYVEDGHARGKVVITAISI